MGRSLRELVLAGDVGGTKTLIGLFRKGRTRPVLEALESYPSREADGLAPLIERFLAVHRVSVGAACFGVAGPVIRGRSETTNLPWTISAERIKKRFHWGRVTVINDLEAMSWGVVLLTGRELSALNRRRIRRCENLGLVAPGTGLGVSLILRGENGSLSLPSEGGHADFAPNNREEMALWRYLRDQYGHVSVERVLSGPGLADIYQYCKTSGRYREPAWLASALGAGDPARIITEAAMEKNQPLCRRVLEIFCRVLGAVSGNLALTGLCTGGVYLGGGIPPKILPFLEEGHFMEAFVDKGRFRGFMEQIAVRVILNQRTALLGAASCALEEE
jgi:glucokinase